MNRSGAQIHALLYLSAKALTRDEIRDAWPRPLQCQASF